MAAFTIEFPRTFESARRGAAWEMEVDGRALRLSNLDKVYWPDARYTKGDLLAAYFNLAPLILPHLLDRPLTLLRMPDGAGGTGFFEKHAPAHTPEWIPRAWVEGHGHRGAIDYLLAQDTASLLFVANLGCIEMHPLHARQLTLGRPDYAFFDLDPFPPIAFAQVRRVALLVKVALDRLRLRSVAKTSGATGMQIYVPLDGSHTFEEARAFVERVCRLIHRSWPDGTTMEREISKRAGKVFLDHAMVREGANIASVYSIRATPRATVSTPLRWEEVDGDVEPGDFTIANVWERLAREGDLFADVLSGGTPEGQNLRAAMDDLGIEAPTKGEEPLAEYRKKRRFEVTPEPSGIAAPSAAQPVYMIHKHHARRLHYDLRLERDGVLVSFAVPKGLPEEPGVRRLAVHVEDHPRDYATFHGHIPDGEYGAGEVLIFDSGTYETLEWTDSKISVRLLGSRVRGEYHLVQTRQGADGKNWLVFRSARDAPIARPAPAPSGIEPMLATSGGTPFDSDDWVFEPKWDGVRALAWIDGDHLRISSRRGRDVTALYPELAVMSERLSGYTALIDGEIVALDESGNPSFERIQQRFTLARATSRALQETPVDFLAFDLLWLDGESLLDHPMEERHALLEHSLAPGPHVQISPQVRARGVAFFEAAAARGLEGIVAKRLGSLYHPGRRSKDWVKVKARRTQDCVIVGWMPGAGSGARGVASLLCAVVRDGRLEYAGHCGTGFDRRSLTLLARRLAPLSTTEPALEKPPPSAEVDARAVHWVRPALVCAVEYQEFTSQGRMRAASFRGLRDDKAPEECVVEE